jgi:hypothetical protein
MRHLTDTDLVFQFAQTRFLSHKQKTSEIIARMPKKYEDAVFNVHNILEAEK